jgi:hypothetical protein
LAVSPCGAFVSDLTMNTNRGMDLPHFSTRYNPSNMKTQLKLPRTFRCGTITPG